MQLNFTAELAQLIAAGARERCCSRRRIGRGCCWVCRVALHYTPMIKIFSHKGVEAFFKKGTNSGIQAVHSERLRSQIAQLNQAQSSKDMNLPGWRLRPLSVKLEGHWAVSVSGNWRLAFRFDEGDALLVDYQDYD